VADRGKLLDRLTQRWVKMTGRVVGLDEATWLDGPIGRTAGIADTWLDDQARRLGGTASSVAGQGLLPSMAVLDGDEFDSSLLQPAVRDFYEATDNWRLEVWSQWSPWFVPGAWLLMRLFARRLQQFSLPLRPLETSHGMSSTVTQVLSPTGECLGAGWQRTVRRTGETIYAGWYGTTTLPGADRRSVRVAFPLPNGSLQVFLRPSNGSGGALLLTSDERSFGGHGTYLVINGPGRSARTRTIPISERFEVFVDDDGTPRTDHTLRLWNRVVLRLHYRVELHAHE